ncbi:Zinc knuckle [Popillia japonica]|uniref:Zinc knuckle n=1 Tax=Popillia japonica TaxID=7064 RepID=A0AAW1JYJ2_POPJA
MAGILEERTKISLFDGSNFNNWKFRIEILLEELELLELIDEPYTQKVKFLETDTADVKVSKEKLKKRDRKCRLQIVQRIVDTHLEYVKDTGSAFEMWSTLLKTFERRGIARQLLIRKSLLTLKFVNTQSMEAHILKFDTLIRELRSTEATLVESDVVCHLLLTMPSEYDTIVTALETLSAENLTLSFAKNRLLEEESQCILNHNCREFCRYLYRKEHDGRPWPREEFAKNRLLEEESKKRNFKPKVKNENQQNIAFVTSTKRNTVRGNAEEFKFKCYNCGIVGHKRSECKKPQKRNDFKNSNAEAKAAWHSWS